MKKIITNFIKSIMPSSRTGKDPLRCVMRDGSPCPYRPIPLGDLKLTHWMRHKIYKSRLKPAVIDTPRHDKKLMIIVPYRHREPQLEKFPGYVKNFLNKQGIKNEILVVEQHDDEPFNKGKLLNIGAELSFEKCDYFCFHDIDMLPQIASYAYINHPMLLANSVSQFDNDPRHSTYFGGVILFNKEDFLKSNGFSNNYWHWGCEDDDLHIRCLLNGLTPVAFKEGRFVSQAHEKSIARTADGKYHRDQAMLQKLNTLYLRNKKIYKKVRRGIIDPSKEGLNTLEYKFIKEEKFELYRKISVEL